MTTSVPRTPGREKIKGSTAEDGYLHCGPNGAGHFVKMVHNGMEYGIMAAYAEGMNILRNANVGKQTHTVDAETTPLRHPELLSVRLQPHRCRRSVAARQRYFVMAARSDRDRDGRGSASSRNLRARFPTRAKAAGPSMRRSMKACRQRPDRGALSALRSRGADEFADKLLSAMRYEFGGHLEKK